MSFHRNNYYCMLTSSYFSDVIPNGNGVEYANVPIVKGQFANNCELLADSLINDRFIFLINFLFSPSYSPVSLYQLE